MKWGVWGMALVACSGGSSDVVPPEPEPWVWVDLELGFEMGVVLDPKLAGEPVLSRHLSTEQTLPETGCLASVYAATPSGLTWPLTEAAAFTGDGLSVVFSGRDAQGRVLDPGPVQLGATLDCGERLKGDGRAMVHIVRLGVVSIDFDGVNNIPLAYHKREIYQSGLTLLDGIPEYLNGTLDDAFGASSEPPEPWTQPQFPPWRSGSPGTIGDGQHNIPTAFTAATPVQLSVVFGATATSALTGQSVQADGPSLVQVDLPNIRVVVDGYELSDDGLWAPGVTRQLSATTALPGVLGRHDLSMSWRYQALHAGQWVDVPGTHSTTHPMYLLMGPTAVPDGEHIDASPAVSWIGVIEDLADAVTGLPADNPDVIMDALRESLHNDPWFVYNPNDSAYSDFEGPYIYWDAIWVEMSAWLDREDGVELYCHSVACVLSSQANHLGLMAHYLTLGVNFRTHLVRSGGSEEWRRWSFNSHGITEFEGKVWDAAVDIDGDSSPNSQPVDPVQPMGLEVEAYFVLLTDDEVDTVNFGRCFVY